MTVAASLGVEGFAGPWPQVLPEDDKYLPRTVRFDISRQATVSVQSMAGCHGVF